MGSRNVLTMGLLTAVWAAGMFAQDVPKRVHIGGAVQQAQLVTQVAPIYPPLAKQARIQGTVRLQAIIGLDGRVLQLEVISGHPLMQQAALEAVAQWRYKPTLLNGVPVEVVTTIDVVFTLDGAAPVATPPEPAVEIARLREEIAAKPADSGLHRKLASAYLRNHDLDGAVASIRESMRLAPEDTRARLMLGQILLNQKYDYAGAVAEYREALLRKPDDPVVCALLARAHEFVYDYGQAVAQYAECIRLQPADLAGYPPLAAALYQKEKLDRATAEFRKYAALHPNPAAVYFQVAGSFQAQNLPAAMAQARETLRVQPEHAEARELLGRLESSLPDQQQRILDLRQYIAGHPSDTMGYAALSYMLHLTAGDHEGALETMRQSVSTGADADLSRLAEEAVEAKGFEGAITELRKLASRYPESASVRRALAGLLLKKGLAGEALEVAREAVRLAPENREARVQLARALSLAGEAEAARQEMQTSATLSASANRPPVNSELANIMLRGAQPSGADPVITANEASAVGAMRTLNTALVVYRAKYENGYAPSLAALGPGNPPTAQAADLIDATLAGGTRNGYVFLYLIGSVGPEGAVGSYAVSATPLEPGKTGRRFFYTDHSGIIRYSINGPATATSPPLS